MGAAGDRRPARRALAVLGLLLACGGLALAGPPAGLTKEFELDGSVDCDAPSGRPCPLGEALAVWTDDVGGVLERVVLHPSEALRRELAARGLERDEVLCLLVRDRPEGGLEALGLAEPCDAGGTDNPGRSSGAGRAAEQPRRGDDDDAAFVPTAAAAATAAPTPTGAATATAPRQEAQ